MSNHETQTRGLDTERLVLVPVLSLLLLASVADLWSRSSGTDVSDASSTLTAVDQLLRVCFYVLMVTLLLSRRPSKASAGSRVATWAAYLGTFTPFLLLVNADPVRSRELTGASIVVITVGLGFSVYSLTYLGRSFGVVPRARELVRTGPYRYVRHPLYVGEFISFAGAVMAVLSPYGIALFVFFVLVQSFRATQEEGVLKEAFPEYEAYMAESGRFVPRVPTSIGA
ncbi:hypothetical protein GCM10027601_03470 [Nocardioides ungokensis]